MHIADRRLYDSLVRRGLVASTTSYCELQVFDMFANSARRLFREHPLDYQWVGEQDRRRIHLVLIGLGRMGEALLLQTAKIGHFANQRKAHVTVVDAQANQKQRMFLGRYPQLPEACSVDFVEGVVEDPDVLRRLGDWAEDPAQLLSVAVCFDDDHRSVCAALYLPDPLQERGVPVYVRLSETTGLATLLTGCRDHRQLNLVAFGSPEQACSADQVLDRKIDLLARQIHDRWWRKRQAEGAFAATVPRNAAVG